MFVPQFLLNKVYVPKSLKNNAQGFELKLKNVVDTGTIGGLKSLTLDGVEVPLASITLITSAGEKRAEEITYRNAMTFRVNAELTLAISGTTLTPGTHQLVLVIAVIEVGRLELKIEDTIE
jgi:hypothetical protein